MNKYHTIVVGAGIPGLYAARELSKAGKSVLIIDRNQSPGGSNYSTAGIPEDAIKRFDIPKQGINCEITNFYFATSHSETLKTGTDILGYVLDFKKTKALMSNEVTQFGGTVKWGCSYIKPIFTKGKVTAIETTDGVYEAEYFIDASGVEAKLSKDTQVYNLKGELFIGEEYIVEARPESFAKYRQCIAIFLDTKLAPHGYAWVFHNGNNQFKIGICGMSENNKHTTTSLNKRLNVFVDFLGRESIEKILEHHGGTKIITKPPKTLYKENVISIGDTISAINPYLGEGINHGLYSAKYAVQALLKDDLELYSNAWSKYNGIRRFMSHIAFYMLYTRSSQKLYELLIKVMKEQRLTSKDIADIGFRYRFGRAIKKDWLLPFKMILAFIQH